MEVSLPPELETKLVRAADRRGVEAQALVLEAIERALGIHFRRAVELGTEHGR